MKKFFFLLLLTCVINKIECIAQNLWPPVYEIRSDTAYSQKIDSIYWQKLEDKEGKWTFDNVSKPPLSDKFHIKGIKAEGVDTSDIHTYWIRYRLKNVMDHDANIALISYAHYYDVFIKKGDSEFTHYKSGFFRKWDQKDGLIYANENSATDIGPGAITISVKPGQEAFIYDRRNRNDVANFRLSVRFLNTEQLIQRFYVGYVDGRINYYDPVSLQDAFILGLLLLAIFLNISFYKIVKERVYLYFALFALFLSINRLYTIVAAYLSHEYPSLFPYVPYLKYAWGFIPLFLIQFFRHFLKLNMSYPVWSKILIGLGILNLAASFAEFLSDTLHLSFAKAAFDLNELLSFTIIPICIIITLFLYLRKKDKSIRYIIIGSFPYLCLYLVYSFWEFAAESSFTRNFRLIELISLSWLVLSLTLTLMLRFVQLRKENAQQALDKERLAKEKEIERNELIAKQKSDLEKEVAERTADLKRSLEDLKSTQSQLIQSEKMASLGELTAGIAHEIQNPLNFVNNFSEVNTELIDELEQEIDKGNLEDVKALAKDIKENEQKINHHGKRADAIVKGMLQHSRSSSGVKEPTDINKLADGYLRLAYHGLRAKDKSFNATMKTDFDESIGSINIIPQDIGRCILNLITNAFYAVAEKKKQAGTDYEPVVTVSTKRINDKVGIIVKDNGMGIPQKVVDKIFQPFFTTKPAGQGTGLGLSMSYDIITNGHGGELTVETREGEGSQFIVKLPA